MRRALFPGADAGLESNLWFSPLVSQRNSSGLVLVPECRDELRRQLGLGEHRDVLNLAWRTILACHRPPNEPGVPPVIALQEAVTYHALAGAGSSNQERHRRAMHSELGSLLTAIDSDADGSLGRWIVGALPSLPDAARRSATAIAIADKLRSRDVTLTLEGIPQVDRSPVSQRMGTVAVGCRRRTDGIEFSFPPADGAHIIAVPPTSPLVIEVQTPRPDGWQSRIFELEPTGGLLVADPTPGSCCRVLALGRRTSIVPTLGESAPVLGVVGVDDSDYSSVHIVADMVSDLGWLVRPIVEGQPWRGKSPDTLLLVGGSEQQGFKPPELERLEWPLLLPTGSGIEVVTPPPAVLMSLGHDDEEVRSAQFLADGLRIGTCSGSGVVRLWEAGTGMLLHTIQTDSGRFATFSPDGGRFLTAAGDGAFSVWSVEGPQFRVEAHRDIVLSVEFDASGRRAVSASRDRSAIVWDVRGGFVRGPLFEHSATVNHCSFSPDGTRVATASDDETVGIWDVRGARIGMLRHGSEVRSVVWSPNGEWILTSDASGCAWLWNAGTLERDPVPFRHAVPVDAAVFSPDGRRIAVAGRSNTWVWHVPSRALMGQAPADVENSPQAVGDGSRRRGARGTLSPQVLMFSPDGGRLLRVASFSRAEVWRLWQEQSRALDPAVIRKLRQFPREPAADLGTMSASLRAYLLARDEQRLLDWVAASTATNQPQEAQPSEKQAADVLSEKGDRALVALVVQDIDVLHETFLDDHGQARFVGVWDQTSDVGSAPPGFTNGTWHDRERIQEHLRGRTSLLLRKGGHSGTHMASIAAGRRAGKFKGGVAPEAALLVIIVPGDVGGYSRSLVDALLLVEKIASEIGLPTVVCINGGLNSGAHDGTSQLEAALDAFTSSGARPGRAIVAPAGSGRLRNGHAFLRMADSSREALAWKRDPRATSSRERVELWWSSADDLTFRLSAPSGEMSSTVNNEQSEVSGTLATTPFSIKLTRRHPDNGDSQLVVELGDRVAEGVWQLEITSRRVLSGGGLHAWIERLDSWHTEFTTHVSDEMTILVPATARSVIAVGAVESGDPIRAASFSSMGPTRDGRSKPDVTAEGEGVYGADGGTVDGVRAMSGTSVAAASVAGMVALVFSKTSKLGQLATANQINAAMRGSTKRGSGAWHPATGHGVVDIPLLMSAFER
jgi:WD40 repeat protein/subtilisin family serine protease